MRKQCRVEGFLERLGPCRRRHRTFRTPFSHTKSFYTRRESRACENPVSRTSLARRFRLMALTYYIFSLSSFSAERHCSSTKVILHVTSTGEHQRTRSPCA